MREFSENQFGTELQHPGAKVPPRERRRHSRYTVAGEAEVIVAGVQLFRGGIRDISLSGCFIETRARPNAAVGTRAELVFRADGTLLRVTASFRAFRPRYGAGFVFDEMNRSTRKGLTRLIEALSHPGTGR